MRLNLLTRKILTTSYVSVICPVCGWVQTAIVDLESKKRVCISCHMDIWKDIGIKENLLSRYCWICGHRYVPLDVSLTILFRYLQELLYCVLLDLFRLDYSHHFHSRCSSHIYLVWLLQLLVWILDI